MSGVAVWAFLKLVDEDPARFTPAQYRMGVQVCRHHNRHTGQCNPGAETLARELGLGSPEQPNKRYAERLLGELETLGVLKLGPSGKGGRGRARPIELPFLNGAVEAPFDGEGNRAATAPFPETSAKGRRDGTVSRRNGAEEAPKGRRDGGRIREKGSTAPSGDAVLPPESGDRSAPSPAQAPSPSSGEQPTTEPPRTGEPSTVGDVLGVEPPPAVRELRERIEAESRRRKVDAARSSPAAERVEPAPAVPDGSREHPVAVSVQAPSVTGLTVELPGDCPSGRQPANAAPTDAELDHVAELGNRSQARGRDVLGEIVEHCGITRSTAAKWREQARRRRAAAAAAGG